MNKPFQLPLALIVTTACASAGSMSPDLKALPPSTPVRVLVQFNGAPSNGVLNAVKADGAVLYRAYKHLDKLKAYTMTAGKAAGLAHRPDILYISLDRTVQKRLDL